MAGSERNVQRTIPDEIFEESLSRLLPPLDEEQDTATLEPVKDETVVKLSNLLRANGNETWSRRPRTYALMYLLGLRGSLSYFIDNSDYSLPYTDGTIPWGLRVAADRRRLLKYQILVLSLAAKDVQTPDQQHIHLDVDGDFHFHPIKELGSGAYGKVDSVWGRLTMEEYARKRIRRSSSFRRSLEQMKDFERELHTLKRLRHQHLVKYVGSYTDPGFVALIMLPVADCDLSAWLMVKPDLRMLRQFFGCLSSAVAYLHNSRVRHKDIKPSNILVHKNNIYLTDFGTAHDWQDLDSSTTEGYGPFTARYAAPEVLLSDRPNSSSDIYSLGCVFLLMLSCLRGHPSDSLFRHLRDTGTREEKFSRNPSALLSWFDLLGHGNISHADSQILRLTRDMLNHERTNRPSSLEITGTIFGLEDNFMCIRCREEIGGLPLPLVSTTPSSGPSTNSSTNPVSATVKEEKRTPNPPSETIPRCPENLDDVLQLQRDAIFQILEERHINVRDPQVRGPTLCRAAHEGDISLVELLAPITQDLEYKDTAGQTALMRAAARRDPSMVRVLLQQTVDPATIGEFLEDGQPKRGHALDIALDRGNSEVVRELIMGFYERDLGVDTGTMLHKAVQRGHADIVTVLLDLGAYPNFTEAYGAVERSAVYVAVLHGFLSIMETLISHGADPSIRESPTGKTIAHAAVLSNDPHVVEGLLDRYISFHETDDCGLTPLHEATRLGNKDIVNLFLRIGLDVNAIDHEGNSPLLLAVQYSHAQLIRPLISSGADLSLRNKQLHTVTTMVEFTKNTLVLQLLLESIPVLFSDGSTLLHRAVTVENVEFVQILLRKIPYTSLCKTEDGQRTPLHLAALSGNETILQALLKQPDCPMKETDVKGNTPLHCALLGKEKNPDKAVRLLYFRDETAIDVNNVAGETPIMTACARNHKSIVRFFLEERGSSELRKLRGNTLLHIAAKEGSHDVIDELLDTGAISATSTNEFGYFPSTLAASFGHMQTARAIMSRPGFNVDAYPKSRPDDDDEEKFSGHTQLMIACLNGHAVLAELLLDLGSDIDHCSSSAAATNSNNNTSTPLLCAISANCTDAVKLLVRRGCDVEAKLKDNLTPLMVAAQLGHAEALKALVEEGGRDRVRIINAATRNGNTALSKAANRGHLAVVRALVDAGASLEKAGRDGYTPLYRAVWRGHREVASLLVERGADRKKVQRMLEWARGKEGRREAVALLREVVAGVGERGGGGRGGGGGAGGAATAVGMRR